MTCFAIVDAIILVDILPAIEVVTDLYILSCSSSVKYLLNALNITLTALTMFS